MNFCSYGCGREGKYQLKNGKWICEDSKNKCPILKQKNSSGERKYNSYKCKYCNQEYKYLKIHEPKCYLNPINLKLCPVCDTPIKNYRGAETCSHKCANNLFKRVGDQHWNFKNGGKNNYRQICFNYHKKECIICGEDIAVDVHHYDGNNKNNHPENLIPLCHTHHLYLKYNEEQYIIKECVDEYYTIFKKTFKE